MQEEITSYGQLLVNHGAYFPETPRQPACGNIHIKDNSEPMCGIDFPEEQVPMVSDSAESNVAASRSKNPKAKRAKSSDLKRRASDSGRLEQRCVCLCGGSGGGGGDGGRYTADGWRCQEDGRGQWASEIARGYLGDGQARAEWHSQQQGIVSLPYSRDQSPLLNSALSRIVPLSPRASEK